MQHKNTTQNKMNNYYLPLENKDRITPQNKHKQKQHKAQRVKSIIIIIITKTLLSLLLMVSLCPFSPMTN